MKAAENVEHDWIRKSRLINSRHPIGQRPSAQDGWASLTSSSRMKSGMSSRMGKVRRTGGTAKLTFLAAQEALARRARIDFDFRQRRSSSVHVALAHCAGFGRLAPALRPVGAQAGGIVIGPTCTRPDWGQRPISAGGIGASSVGKAPRPERAARRGSGRAGERRRLRGRPARPAADRDRAGSARSARRGRSPCASWASRSARA